MAKQRTGLGRGLDALLTGTTAPADTQDAATGSGAGESAPGALQVAVDAIEPNPYQPRREFDEAQLAELADSIRTHGLIQPLTVKREGKGWLLIAGERRWRAAKQAGLATVPVIERDADPQQMLAVAIIENVQRADLDPIESALAYRRLMDEFELTQHEVARLVGKSRPAVANMMRLLGLCDDVRGLIAAGHLGEGHGRALLGVSDEAEQLRFARRAITESWTVRRTEAAVREWSERMADGPAAGSAASTRDASPRESDPDTLAAARALEEALGTKVEIRRAGGRGRLVIHFYSEEDLSALYDRLVDA
jgi:ParB family chromosome partitioning protein